MQTAVWQWTSHMIPLIIGVVFSVASAFYILRQRMHDARSRTGALVLLAGAEWGLGYILELGSTALQAKVLWAKVQYVGIVLFPTVWLIYCLQYTGRHRWLSRRNLVLIGLIPSVALLLAWTNDAHSLMWGQPTLSTSGSISFLVQDFGIGFWIFWAYAILLVGAGFVLLMLMFIYSRHLYRRQIVALMSAAAITGVTTTIDGLHLTPWPYLDLEPYAFVFTALIVAWGLLRLRLGDVMPVAHAQIVRGMGDPVLVLDAQEQVLEMNAAAQEALGLSATDVIGTRWAETCADLAFSLHEDTPSREITVHRDEQTFVYDAHVSSLGSSSDQPVGWIVVLRDVSEHVEQERESQRRQRFLEAVLGAAPDAIVTLDARRHIAEWNAGAERLFGYTRQEALGQDIDRLITDEGMLAEATALSGLVLNGKALPPEETTRRRKDGTLLDVIIAASPILVQGQLSGAIGVYTDITQRKRAEEALRELNQELEGRVAQRTAELAELNAQLVREVGDRRRTEHELLQRNRALLSLQSAVSATASSLDLPFVLETVTWEMVDLLSAEDCAVFEWRQEEDAISVLAQYSLAGLPLPQDRTLALSAHPLRRRMLIERSHQQANLSQPDLDPAERAYLQKIDKGSLLVVSMAFQDRVIGLIEVVGEHQDRVFTDQEVSFAQLLANQAAVTIENARLYDRAQQEIAERMRAEAQIKASLEEKVVLLKEIHHRVKNNLQVISSLLRLQSQQIQDDKTLEIFLESQNRVRSMALIHEKLYRSQDLAKIDFAEYVQSLTSFLVRSYRYQAGRVSLKIDARDVFLSIDDAVPCGLIINELITNAFKYAFPGGTPGEIRVVLRPTHNSHVTLAVSDNGVGFPKDLDFMETESLGLQLVNSLVEQLEGTIELRRDEGTEFEISFLPS